MERNEWQQRFQLPQIQHHQDYHHRHQQNHQNQQQQEQTQRGVDGEMSKVAHMYQVDSHTQQQHQQQQQHHAYTPYTPFVIPNWLPQERNVTDAYAQWQQQHQGQGYYSYTHAASTSANGAEPQQQPLHQLQHQHQHPQHHTQTQTQTQNGYSPAAFDHQQYMQSLNRTYHDGGNPYQQPQPQQQVKYAYESDQHRPSTATPPFEGSSHDESEPFDRLSRSAPASASLVNSGNFPMINHHSTDTDEGEYLGGPTRKKRAPPKDAAARKYVCEDCSQRFARPSALATHILTHTKEKPFKCLTCDRAFGVMSNLRRHCRVRVPLFSRFSSVRPELTSVEDRIMSPPRSRLRCLLSKARSCALVRPSPACVRRITISTQRPVQV